MKAAKILLGRRREHQAGKGRLRSAQRRYQVEEARAGAQAMERFDNRRCNLVITDVMRKLNGLKLTARVHSIFPAYTYHPYHGLSFDELPKGNPARSGGVYR